MSAQSTSINAEISRERGMHQEKSLKCPNILGEIDGEKHPQNENSFKFTSLSLESRKR